VDEARKLMAAQRTCCWSTCAPLEFNQGFIDGSLNIPFIDILDGRHALQKDRPLLLICSIGGRSFAAVQVLQEKGFTHVYNLDGGIQAWNRASLPLRTSR
jgi:rhodanese-related sulfurtransferase